MPDPVKKKTKKKLSKKMIAASRKSAAQLRVLARAKRAKRSVAKPKKKVMTNAEVGSAAGAARLKRKAGKQMTQAQYRQSQKAKKKGVKKPMKPKKKSIRKKMY